MTLNLNFINCSKVGCTFSMAISSEYHMGQFRDDAYEEDAPHFTFDET